MKIRKVLPAIYLLLIFPGIGVAGDSLSAEDVAKIKQVHSKYEEAWLKGDADGVRALFTDDCVLLPPHGDTPRIGQKGLNGFPANPNHKAGSDSSEYRRRWTDRLCVGDG